MISDTGREHPIGRGFAHDNAIGDCFGTRGNGGYGRGVGAVDHCRLRRELAEGDDVRGTDGRRFG